jgi:hypothetical protein
MLTERVPNIEITAVQMPAIPLWRSTSIGMVTVMTAYFPAAATLLA